jgi:hypothetical protein
LRNGDDCKYSLDSRVAILEALLPEKIQGNKDRTDLLFQGRDAATTHQFNEFMRRLAELNGEAGRLREMQASYVPREVYDTKLDDLTKSIRALENAQANIFGRIAVISGAASLLGGGGVAAIITWLKTQ